MLPGAFSLPCPPSAEDFRRVNIALSDPQRGRRDLYGKMTIPGLFRQPLGELVTNAEARQQAASIVAGIPHIFFLLSADDCQRLLFLIMDGKLWAKDDTPVQGIIFTGDQLKAAFVPLATAMCQHMVRLGFSEIEMRERMVAILHHPGISAKVALKISALAAEARSNLSSRT